MKSGRWWPLLLLPALPVQAEVTLELPVSDKVLEQNLRARLALAAEPCDAPEWRVRRLFKRAEQDFQPALRAFGYYQPKIEKRLETEAACWQAHFSIDPGKRTSIRQRTVKVVGEASADKDLNSLISRLPLAEGDPLDHGLYEQIKTELSNYAAERGYFDFNLTRKQLRIYPDEAAAEIDIEAESGRRYRFGELRFSPVPLDEDFIRRLGGVNEGDPYDARALAELDRNLSNAGYFNQVEVAPKRDQISDGAVPIAIELEPARRHAWRTGIGYATDVGPRLTLGYDNRYINPRGHTFESEMRFSPVESGLTADYILPGEDPHRENLSFGARLLHEESDSVYSNSASLIAKQTLKSESWTQTRFIELLHEQSEVGNDNITATLLMPGIGFERMQAGNPLRTRKGYRVSASVRGAYEGLVSTSSLIQLRANAKGIYRFGEGGRVVARAEIGTTLGDSTSNLPASLRFFAGGDNSVRGYEYKSLGPEDSDGKPTGARHVLTGSIEYEHPIVGEDWWLGLFVDAGNAFNTDDFELKSGYGGGLRWFSPIGRIRVDLAFPNDTSADSWRLHIGLGADL